MTVELTGDLEFTLGALAFHDSQYMRITYERQCWPFWEGLAGFSCSERKRCCRRNLHERPPCTWSIWNHFQQFPKGKYQ